MTRAGDRDGEKRSRVGTILGWWKALYPSEGGARGDSGARARMRRAETAVDVVMEPAFHDLLAALRREERAIEPENPAYLALGVVAAVLCERREWHAGGASSFAKVLGAGGDAAGRPLSELRFNALIKTLTHEGPDERLRALRRAMTLTGGADVNHARLIDDLLGPFNDQTRMRWVYDYFQTFHDMPSGDIAGGQTDKETIS